MAAEPATPDLELYVAKYGKKHRDLIAALLAALTAWPGIAFTPRGLEDYLDKLIPRMKLPSFRMADGTLVPATSVTVHGAWLDGTVVAIVVEGEEHEFAPQRVFDHDRVNVTLDREPIRWPAPPVEPAPAPALAQLEEELAEARDTDPDDLVASDLEDYIAQLEDHIAQLEGRIAELKGRP